MKYLVFLILFFLFSCNQSNKDSPKKFKIGFSQCTIGDAWRKTMNEEMKREIGLHPQYDIEFIIKDAHNIARQQIQDIEQLVDLGIDILLVSPNDADSLNSVVEMLYDKGIPVILIDRKISSDKFTAYIGGENYIIGKEAGHFAVKLLNNKGNILEITGLFHSTPAMERSIGFHDALKGYPNIKVVKIIDGGWLINQAKQLTDSLFYEYKDFDLIFAHNDQMALAAYLSCQNHKIKPFILGVDGLNVPNGGIDMVLNGYIDGTFLYPTGGDKAIELALNILEGKPYLKINQLTTIRIDRDNVKQIKNQSDQLIYQQTKIDKQREIMWGMELLLNKQKTFLVLFTLIIGLLFLISSMIFYFFHQKNKLYRVLNIKNKTISDQNKQITSQRDKLLRVSRIVEEAYETKSKYFTNITHEFRQALCLVIHPVNELVKLEENVELRQKMLLVQKNTQILSTLSDEILNLDKIERIKYYLNFKVENLGKFLIQIIEYFKPEFYNKDIKLNINIPDPLEASFDALGIEKVMANLLSNAIKNTNTGGKISIELTKNHKNITVSVSNTGIGIPEQLISKVFDRYYRVNQPGKNVDDRGSGLGLNICKEIIQLHHGQINVTSKLTEGSTFFFTFPQYWEKSELTKETVEREKLLELKNPLKKPKILIVEDNSQILSIIVNILDKTFATFSAENGEIGFRKALDHRPDLVISDIYMPVMDGIDLCKRLKEDPSTFHIPVILITALDSEDYRIRGYDIGADGYVVKPFNEKILISLIQNLIKSRKKLQKEFWKFDLLKGIKLKGEKEEEFVQKCLKIIFEYSSDETFNLNQLAIKMNLSKSSFGRRIKEITGIKAIDFLKKGKLQYAAKLLLTTNLSVCDVAYESGFTDTKYFSKCFAKEFGHVPSKFKQIAI